MCYPSVEFGRSRSNDRALFRRFAWKWRLAFCLSRSLKVIGTDTDWSATCDFLLKFYSNHEPLSYHFRDIRRLLSNIANFRHPVYLTSRWRGFPWNWVSALGGQKLVWWGYQGKKEVWRYLQPSGYNYTNVTDRATDWQTDTGRQHRPRSPRARTRSVAR